MEVNLDRYFELEEKLETNTMNAAETKEWERLNKGLMSNRKIENALENDFVHRVTSQVKLKLDTAFDDKFGTDSIREVKHNNVIPLDVVKRLWQPTINWAAIASVAAIFVVVFMLKPNTPTQSSSTTLLADTSYHQSVDTTNSFSVDSLLN